MEVDVTHEVNTTVKYLIQSDHLLSLISLRGVFCATGSVFYHPGARPACGMTLFVRLPTILGYISIRLLTLFFLR